MTYQIITTRLYRCLCDQCEHEWDAYQMPIACPKCRRTSWNGTDRRRGRFVRERIADKEEVSK